MPKIKIAASLAVLLTLVGGHVFTGYGSPVSAQETAPQARQADDRQDEGNAGKSAIVEAKTAFEKMAALISEDKFEEATQGMTADAIVEFAAEPIINGLAMQSMQDEMAMEATVPDEYIEEFEARMEEMEEQFAEYELLIEEYGLQDHEFTEEIWQNDQVNEFSAEILATLDENGNRWKAFKAFRDVSTDGLVNIFDSEIVDEEFADNKVFLELKPDYGEMMMGPSLIVSLDRVDGVWVFEGTDMDKSEELMEEFYKEDMEDMEFEEMENRDGKDGRDGEDAEDGESSSATSVEFEAPVKLDAIQTESPGYASPCMADMDGDGKKELLVGQFNGGKISVFKNAGNTEFESVGWIEVDGEPAEVPGVW